MPRRVGRACRCSQLHPTPGITHTLTLFLPGRGDLLILHPLLPEGTGLATLLEVDRLVRHRAAGLFESL